QGQAFLDSGRSAAADVLPQFPGLDGGGFGHWGQNPEDVSFDRSLNETETGNVVSQLTRHFGRTTAKAVNVRLDANSQTAVLFDPEQLTFTEAWDGSFVVWGFVRFGLMDGVRIEGRRLWPHGAGQWQLPDGTVRRYLGFYRAGERVVFVSQIGAARVLDECRFADGRIIRSLLIDGSLPAGAALRLATAGGGAEFVQGPQERSLRISENGLTERMVLAENAGTAQLQVLDGSAQVVFGDRPARELKLQLETFDGAAEARDAQPLSAAFTDANPLLQSLSQQQWPQDLPGQWVNRRAETLAVPGDGNGPLTIDTLTLPHFPQNPFRSAMRIGGVGCLSDGRIAVATLMGEVWLCSGSENIGGSNRLSWQRIAAGLYRGLGLVVQQDQVLVLGSDQITRLHDLNGDSEADFYECVTNEYPTTGGHDFCTSLQQTRTGDLYWSVSARDFGVAHRDSSGRMESLGSGLRNSNGIGVSPDGSVVLASVQEGTWTPASAIFEVSQGSYHGLNGPRPNHGRYGYDLPLLYLPRGVDNSSGEIGYLPEDARLGALSGAAVGTSFGACQAYVVLRDVVGGRGQGAIVPLPGDYLSGVCRVAWNARDGGIYLGGTEGWQSYAAEDGCLQRLRRTANPLVLPQSFEAWGNGIKVRFSEPLDPTSVSAAAFFCQQWNYLYSAGYGSPEYSVKEPGRQGHDHVPVKSARLLPDGRTVFLEIPQLHPVMQFHLHARLKTASGAEFRPDVFATILNQRADFQDFDGYVQTTKRPAPDFPIAEKYEQDPRLVQQEQFGTNFGWVSSSLKLSFGAAPGLQYEPRVLRVPPGARVSLAFRNSDPGMPHNAAVVKAEAVEEFGEQSMQLASNPRAIATHYVPEDPRELCFTPILQPGDAYTMYFEAPQEPGEYRILCTYPGHWRVMQATLYVLPADAPLPASAAAPVRSFVRMWSTAELSNVADRLQGRSAAQGEAVFASAGCIKCHRLGETGSILGPELTKISDRYKGTRLLQQILEPSHEINKQYQTWVAVLTDGRAVSGLKLEESAESVTLLPNPLKPET
ncbi:MAG TPA: hypothetical protein DCR20_07070, partial [Planctomycetaceae bacterium]|nr:hypothetical protein [Planctomycetaceae bacterium]